VRKKTGGDYRKGKGVGLWSRYGKKEKEKKRRVYSGKEEEAQVLRETKKKENRTSTRKKKGFYLDSGITTISLERGALLRMREKTRGKGTQTSSLQRHEQKEESAHEKR